MSRVRHLRGQRLYFAVGDSKSVANSTYHRALVTYLEGQTAQNWQGIVHATAGWTAATAVPSLPDALTTGANVHFALVNLGANDVQVVQTEATWKTNYASILDQIHARWPDIPVYVAQVYRSTEIPTSETINQWISDVIADGRSGWASIAFNEFDWLPEWSTDGVHPSGVMGGYSEMARQWYAAAMQSR